MSDTMTIVDEAMSTGVFSGLASTSASFKPHLDAIRASVRAGFRFRHLPSFEDVAALQGFLVAPPIMDMYLVRGPDDAFAARLRLDDLDRDEPPALWHKHGPVEDVVLELLELPPGDKVSSLIATQRRPSDWSVLWVPG